jgi:hypothetical protein
VKREGRGSGRRDEKQPVHFLEQRNLFIGETEESIYLFLQKVRHEVVGEISGKDDDAGMGVPRFDVGDDALDPGGGKLVFVTITRSNASRATS